MNRDPWQKYALETYQQQIKPIVDGGFNPLLYPLIAWYKASDVVITSGGVSQWTDKSGNGRHAIQASSGNRPTQQLVVLNGRETVRFDGSDVLKATFGATFAQPNTILIVWNITATNAAGLYVPFDGIASGNRHYAFWQGGGTYIHAGGGFILMKSQSLPKAFTIDSFIFNTTSGAMRENGVLLNTGNIGTQSLTGLSIGADYSNTYFLVGDIAEIFVIQGLLSTVDHNAFLNALSTDYGITTTPIV